jgi:hypothetical protein
MQSVFDVNLKTFNLLTNLPNILLVYSQKFGEQ